MTLLSPSMLLLAVGVAALSCLAVAGAITVFVDSRRRHRQINALLESRAAYLGIASSPNSGTWTRSASYDFGAFMADDVSAVTESATWPMTDAFDIDSSTSLSLTCVNPTTGLLMLMDSPCGLDIGGNAYGSSFSAFDSWS